MDDDASAFTLLVERVYHTADLGLRLGSAMPIFALIIVAGFVFRQPHSRRHEHHLYL